MKISHPMPLNLSDAYKLSQSAIVPDRSRKFLEVVLTTLRVSWIFRNEVCFKTKKARSDTCTNEVNFFRSFGYLVGVKI